MNDRYFDHAATTPLDSRVFDAMLPFLREDFGNANSIHSLGLRAREAVEKARGQVAMLLGAEDPSQITFTSGATEANNWVLGIASRIVISPFEHSAMLEPALRRGATVMQSEYETLVAPPKTVLSDSLLSVMAVNNETGTMWNAADYASAACLVHSDVTQVAGKMPFRLGSLDFASFSAHKFYGPKGIGALYARADPPPPLILGGEQEGGYRGGTLNVASIVGMGEAAKIAIDELESDAEHAAELRELFLDGLKGLSDVRINGGARTSPYILSVSFRGLEGETLVLEMDRFGYSISAGAACSSRSTEPSHVLLALKVEPEWLRGTVRISFGRANSKEATQALAKKLRAAAEMLRTL